MSFNDAATHNLARRVVKERVCAKSVGEFGDVHASVGVREQLNTEL